MKNGIWMVVVLVVGWSGVGCCQGRDRLLSVNSFEVGGGVDWFYGDHYEGIGEMEWEVNGFGEVGWVLEDSGLRMELWIKMREIDVGAGLECFGVWRYGRKKGMRVMLGWGTYADFTHDIIDFKLSVKNEIRLMEKVFFVCEGGGGVLRSIYWNEMVGGFFIGLVFRENRYGKE